MEVYGSLAHVVCCVWHLCSRTATGRIFSQEKIHEAHTRFVLPFLETCLLLYTYCLCLCMYYAYCCKHSIVCKITVYAVCGFIQAEQMQ